MVWLCSEVQYSTLVRNLTTGTSSRPILYGTVTLTSAQTLIDYSTTESTDIVYRCITAHSNSLDFVTSTSIVFFQKAERHRMEFYGLATYRRLRETANMKIISIMPI